MVTSKTNQFHSIQANGMSIIPDIYTYFIFKVFFFNLLKFTLLRTASCPFIFRRTLFIFP